MQEKKGYTNAESISVEQLIQIADSVNDRLSQADQEELQKCKDSPVYNKDRPLTPDQCYEKLPDFLKNGG